MGLSARLQRELGTKLVIIFAICWLAVVAWQAFPLLWRAGQSTGRTLLSTRLSWGLLAGTVGGLAGLIVIRLWRPRCFIAVLAVGTALSCTFLLVTSRQLLSGLATLWLGVWAWLIGLTILDRLRIETDPIARLVLSLVLGMGTIAILVLVIGLLGLLSAWWVLAISAVMMAGLVLVSRQAIAASKRGLVDACNDAGNVTWFASFCLVLLAAFVVLNWIGALAPEIMFDALKSHLALARIYASSHQVSGVPYSMGSYWPLGGDLLLTVGYLLGGETAAKLLHFWAGLLTAGMVYAAGRRLDSRLAGVAAATIFYAPPIIAWESTTAYTDLCWTMYVAGALFMLLVWQEEQHPVPAAAAMGLLLGFAMGVKPTAGYAALGVGLVMLWRAWRSRSKQWRRDVWSFVVVTSVTILVGGIWYLRAYLLTGNPVFPFLNAVFKSPLWYPRNERFNYRMYGFGVTPIALALLPWRLTFVTSRFCETLDGTTGALYLGLAPLVLLFLRRASRLWAIAFVSLFFCLLWAFSVQYLRYLLPALAGLAIMAGWATAAIWGNWRRRGSLVIWILPAVFLAFAAFALPVSLQQYWNIPTLVPFGVVLGRVSREDYCAQRIPSYVTLKYASEHLDGGDRIYGVGEYFQYLSALPLITPIFTVEGDAILKAQSEASLVNSLAAAEITHVVINRPQVVAYAWDFRVHSKEFLERHTVLEYAANDVYLYRLLRPGRQMDPTGIEEERLQNGGFADLADGHPSHWTAVGQPFVCGGPARAAQWTQGGLGLARSAQGFGGSGAAKIRGVATRPSGERSTQQRTASHGRSRVTPSLPPGAREADEDR